MTAVDARRGGPPADELALLRGLLSALAAFRWAAWVWMAVVAVIDLRNGPVAHPAVMVALVAVALAVTIVDTVLVRVDPARLLAVPTLVVELGLGLTLVGLDHWVYGVGSEHAQSLGSVWPLAGVLAIGVRFGGWGGVVAGVAVGVTAWLGEVLVVPGRWYGDRTMGSLGTIVLYALGGGVGGLTAARLREARRTIALARARDEVARTLHDGVLQTLAVVQRRSDDPSLVRLAREQEVELRQFLFGTAAERAGRWPGRGRDRGVDVVVAVRAAAARAERTHGLRVEVAAAPDVPLMAPEVAEAIAAAAAEAMTNAAKHGDATRVTVFIDVEFDDGEVIGVAGGSEVVGVDGSVGDEVGGGAVGGGGDGRAVGGGGRRGVPVVMCSVKDDGCGFEAAQHPEGAGLRGSVRGRMADVGGRAEVQGRPGRGAEVRLWAPVAGGDRHVTATRSSDDDNAVGVGSTAGSGSGADAGVPSGDEDGDGDRPVVVERGGH